MSIDSVVEIPLFVPILVSHRTMSQFIQLFKSMGTNSTPSSPSPTKKEGRFRKFRRNPNRSSAVDLDSGTNLSKKRSVSTSALTQLREDEETDNWMDRHRRQRTQTMSEMKVNNSFEENKGIISEPKNQISVKELIEKMILHLQVLERKNQTLSQNIQQLTEEKTSLETDLSSAKVELNLYKNRLNQIEKICDEWHCSVCMDNKIKIINTKRVIVSTFCGHLFCSSCAQTFVSTSRQSKHCPTCRKPLKEGQLNYHPIYI